MTRSLALLRLVIDTALLLRVQTVVEIRTLFVQCQARIRRFGSYFMICLITYSLTLDVRCDWCHKVLLSYFLTLELLRDVFLAIR